jgi:hypothetical protein
MMVAFLVIIIGAGTGTAALPGWQTLFRRSETADRVEMSKGTALTGGMGKLPVVQVMDAVADADSDDVLAATAIPTGASALSVVTSGISDPDVYRNVTATGSASGADGCIVTVYGTDWAGKAVSEAITLTGASTVQGNRPFAAINMITIGGVGSPGGATASVGIGEKLGLYRLIAAASDVSQIAHKATDGTAWTLNTGGQLPVGANVSADYSTVDPETTIGDADGYMITYNTAAW